MPLSKQDLAIWRKARAAGSGKQGVGLDDAICGYLLALIVHDLGLRETFPQVPAQLGDFFEVEAFTSPFPQPRQVYDLDGTPNPKLQQLVAAFRREGGEAFVGEAAWQHLDDLAGATMATFLNVYIREPLNRLIAEETEQPLPELTARDQGGTLSILIGGEELRIERLIEATDDGGDELPDDVTEEMPNAPG